MVNIIAKCGGYPLQRDTVRPCEQCQMCAHWKNPDTEAPRFEVPPAAEFEGVLICRLFTVE